MKTAHNFPSQHLHQCHQTTLQQTTLAQIQSSHFTSQISTHPSYPYPLTHQPPTPSSSPQHRTRPSSQQFCIVEVNGHQYHIHYENIHIFQKCFQKVSQDTSLKESLAVKVVLLAKLVKINSGLDNLLEKCMQQYGNRRLQGIQLP